MPAPPASTSQQALRWDLFCRVVDNFGDIGVCWRLASSLARRGQQVRLWVDDASALAWMAPDGAPGVTVLPWPDAWPPPALPGDVVVEAYGCDPPPAFIAQMAAAPRPPVWINLEYLSAEAYAARSHGLASPQWSGPGAGLTKWFFYPGFDAATGGLLQGDTSPAGSGIGPNAAGLPALRAGERRVSLFCYANPQLLPLLQGLASTGPVQLLAAPSPALTALQALQALPAEGGPALPAGLRLCPLPLLPQTSYDRLLAGCALNIVRGEDSFVRAQLCSDAPMLWQAYPQADGAHGPKISAFLDAYLAMATPAVAQAVRALFMAFNGLAPWPVAGPSAGPPARHLHGPAAWLAPELLAGWAKAHGRWRARCLQAAPLDSQLLRFVHDRR